METVWKNIKYDQWSSNRGIRYDIDHCPWLQLPQFLVGDPSRERLKRRRKKHFLGQDIRFTPTASVRVWTRIEVRIADLIAHIVCDQIPRKSWLRFSILLNGLLVIYTSGPFTRSKDYPNWFNSHAIYTLSLCLVEDFQKRGRLCSAHGKFVKELLWLGPC